MPDHTELQRVTTEYVAIEDRVRLSGETAGGQTVVLWLTQRMLNRLTPPLIRWLERPVTALANNELVQEFAQQAAEHAMVAEPAVRAVSPLASWRVVTVDIQSGPDGVALTFKSDEDPEAAEHARLMLQAQALRQWLGILHNQYVAAGWPTSAWPAWMDETHAIAANPVTMALH